MHVNHSRAACAGLVAAFATDLPAGHAQSVRDAYLQDSRGEVVRASGLCMRNGYWTPAQSIAACDPEIAPRPAAPRPAPRLAAPVDPRPAPAPATPTTENTPASAAAIRRCDFAETLGSDDGFDFNRSTLKTGVRLRLDALAARATGCGRIDVLTVTGHADRLGSAAHNQTLSELRAQAVAAYLVSKGMPQARASGAGTTLPVKACGAVRKPAELVACLAPNRRVVIEVRGTTP